MNFDKLSSLVLNESRIFKWDKEIRTPFNPSHKLKLPNDVLDNFKNYEIEVSYLYIEKEYANQSDLGDDKFILDIGYGYFEWAGIKKVVYIARYNHHIDEWERIDLNMKEEPMIVDLGTQLSVPSFNSNKDYF